MKFKRLFTPQLIILNIALMPLLAGVWWYQNLFNDPHNDWWFDAKLWQAQHGNTDSDNLRGKMAEDAKNRVLKTGMSKKQVLDILGPPDGGSDATSFSYNIGSWGAFQIDPELLVVSFNANERVSSVGLSEL